MTETFQYSASGGTLAADNPSYIERQADTDLFQALKNSEYCYVLNSRQMGKSSLIVRVAQRLREENIQVAVIELTKLGSSNTSAEKWYRSLLDVLGKALGKRAELVECWKNNPDFDPLYRWMLAVQTVVKASDDYFVIGFDEIDSVRTLPFSMDEFFAAIRSCFNDRVQDTDLQRLTFCLIGVVTPSELIRDTRMTPFNIGKRIDLQDFSLEEMQPLMQGLEREPILAQKLLQRIAYWTNGQPYLTQKLCQAVADDKTIVDAKGIDRLCEELFFSSRSRDSENNLQHVRTQLLAKDQDQIAILELYRQVWRGESLKDDDTNPSINLLRLVGLVRTLKNHLQIRNNIYFRVFDETWIIANLPDAEKQRQKAAQRRGFLQAAGIAAVMLSVVGGLAIWGWTAEQEAVKQKELAVAAREAAVKNEQLAENQRNIALQQKEIALKAINTLTYQLVDSLENIPRTQPIVEKTLQGNVALLERIYALDPDTPRALREKSVNLNKTGDMWLRFGKIDEAVAAYQESLEIRERLAASDPTDAQAQRDLSISYEKIGDVQLRLGNANDALRAYQQSLEIRERLAASDPTDAQAQRLPTICPTPRMPKHNAICRL
jgi:tetratricopeptide (TPR) repeat protein